MGDTVYVRPGGLLRSPHSTSPDSGRAVSFSQSRLQLPTLAAEWPVSNVGPSHFKPRGDYGATQTSAPIVEGHRRVSDDPACRQARRAYVRPGWQPARSPDGRRGPCLARAGRLPDRSGHVAIVRPPRARNHCATGLRGARRDAAGQDARPPADDVRQARVDASGSRPAAPPTTHPETARPTPEGARRLPLTVSRRHYADGRPRNGT